MKFFPVILCFIPLYLCSGLKRPRLTFDHPQDQLTITFLKGAFKNVPDEILQHILYLLPFRYQLTFSSVNSFWFDKYNFFQKTNLDYSTKIFLETTTLPSKVPFEKLLHIIDCFTDYWEKLCLNSKDTNFLNQRSQLEASLGHWLFINMEQIMSPKWHTSLNEEGDTFSYILLQRLLFSPFFFFTTRHPIWEAMAAHNETRIRAACDFLLQVPIILGKIAITHLFQCTGKAKRFFQVAIERGIELDMLDVSINSLICKNPIQRQLILLKDIHREVKILAPHVIPLPILKLESILVMAIETGSIDIFRDGFLAKFILRTNPNYKVIRDKMMADGFELAYICPCTGKESYTKPIIPFIIAKHPSFLPFLFKKILTNQVPNRSQILAFLCFFIPKEFEYRQIDMVAIVSILSPIISGLLLPDILENFHQMTGEAQIDIFKHIIKKGVNQLVFNWEKESMEESYVCIDNELRNASLFFNTAPPVFPLLCCSAQMGAQKAADKIKLYCFTKIGLGIGCCCQNSLVAFGKIISADKFKSTLSLRQSRKLRLPDRSEVDVFCQITHTEQAQEDENGGDK